eukprot:3369935-Lingulodinium_polyedra.AAC.1
MARDNYRFSIRVNPRMVHELRNVFATLLDERTAGLALPTIGGSEVWVRPGIEQSPTAKAKFRKTGDYQKALTQLVKEKNLEDKVEVLN